MEKPNLVEKMLKRNRAAALGCAIVLATGLLGGCTDAGSAGDTAQWQVYEEDDDDDDYRYYGGSHGGYYIRSGHPIFNTQGQPRWSKPSGTYKSGGYGIIRGGSAVS